jgi:hypothetical protein
MSMKMKVLTFLTLFFCAHPIWGQKKFREHAHQEDRNKGKAFLINIGVATYLPGGDLADRFGVNGGLHAGFDHISAKNLLFGVNSDFFFGSIVREDPLTILRTPEGDIIGRDQALAEIFLRQRGLQLGAHAGKLFPLLKEKRSGLRITLGLGWTLHKFRFQDESKSVNQVVGEYAKGYDRLSAGINLQQFIGWQHLGRLRRNNWMLGFDLQQGFTNTQRDWDFSSKRKLDEKRLDLRFGMKFVWTVPIYRQKAEEIFY